MNAQEIIEKIRAEVNRLKNDRYFLDDNQQLAYWEGLNKVSEKLSDLEKEEKPSEGLEEEFRRFIKKEKEEEPDGSLPCYGDYGIYRIARHFAEWGAEHLKK